VDDAQEEGSCGMNQWAGLQKRYKAVIFDLDGTLRHDLPPAAETSFEYARELGALYHPARRRQAMRWVHYYWAQSPELADDLRRFNDDLSQEFWTFYTGRTLQQLGCSSEEAERLAPEVQRLMAEHYAPEDIVPEEAHMTLRSLKNRGIRLGLVSNRSRAFPDVLEKHRVGEYFDYVLAAGEINTWKPDPHIFTYAAKKMQIDPQDALYVGDNYYADIIGAQQAGMPAVLFDPRGVFPDSECPRIEQLTELLDLVK